MSNVFCLASQSLLAYFAVAILFVLLTCIYLPLFVIWRYCCCCCCKVCVRVRSCVCALARVCLICEYVCISPIFVSFGV